MLSQTATTIAENQDFVMLFHGLKQAYPDAALGVQYRSAFELLIATILMSQATDTEVSLTVRNLCDQFPTPRAVMEATRGELERLIRPIRSARQKAKYIQLTCQILIERHHGEVPADFLALTKLPVVARKGANLIMSEIYDITSGMVVETNVKRISARLGLSQGKSIETVEKQLMAFVPEQYWQTFPQLMIAHGRKMCVTNQPRCRHCPLQHLCPTGRV